MAAPSADCLNAEFMKRMEKLECAVQSFNCQEKSIASEWMAKLKNSNSSIEEMTLRNDFINYLVKCTDGGVFRVAPFNSVPPPCGSLLLLKDLLPPDHKCSCMSAQRKKQHLHELFSSTEDRGAFLSTLPVPRNGVFTVAYYHPTNDPNLTQFSQFNASDFDTTN